MAGRCECARACSCCTQTSPSIGVTGSGSAGQCFSPSVRYSADGGNRARAGTDGAVFADTCLKAPDGSTIDPDEAGCLSLPAACILDYNSDPIAPDENGCVQLPAAGVPPAFGCGLASEEDGTLIAATSGTWPTTDALGHPVTGPDTSGGAIYCGIDGLLHGVPEHTSVSSGLAVEVVAAGLQDVAATFDSPSSGVCTLTNPSPSRAMLVMRYVSGVVDLIQPALGGAIVRLQERVNGGAWSTVRELRWPELSAGDASLRSQLSTDSVRAATIAAGTSQQVELRVEIEKTGTGGDPVLLEASVSTRLVGITQ